MAEGEAPRPGRPRGASDLVPGLQGRLGAHRVTSASDSVGARACCRGTRSLSHPRDRTSLSISAGAQGSLSAVYREHASSLGEPLTPQGCARARRLGPACRPSPRVPGGHRVGGCHGVAREGHMPELVGAGPARRPCAHLLPGPSAPAPHGTSSTAFGVDPRGPGPRTSTPPPPARRSRPCRVRGQTLTARAFISLSVTR